MKAEVAGLEIAIIGAGMGGLTTALALAQSGFTNISVYEYAHDLGFVGAGIQMAPNMVRILDRLDVWEDISKKAVVVREASIRQGTTGNEKAHVDLSYIPGSFSHPHTVGHRSTLAQSLYAGCLRYPAIKFHFSTAAAVDLCDPSHPILTLTARSSPATPTAARPAILIAADGIKSSTRAALLAHLGATDRVRDSGQAAYRVVLSRDALSSDPELLSLVDTPQVTRWIAPRRHIIAYPVEGHALYNISTAQPDSRFAGAPDAAYTTRGSKAAMLAEFADLCPTVQKLLARVKEDEVCEWRLRVHDPLPRWALGATVLVGDACHPTLPHVNQGAAQAVEDGAVLGEILRWIKDGSAEELERAWGLYEAVRKDRAEKMVRMAAESGRAMQLGEGQEMEERDKMFAEATKGGKLPDKWADRETQDFLYADCCVGLEERCAAAFGV